MNKKLMVGVLATTLVVGGLIGVNTIGSSSAAPNTAKSTAKAMLSAAEAKQIALAQVYGGGRVDSVELERDDGKVYYEVEIDTKDVEYEIDVDAYSGLILDIDKDYDRDRNQNRNRDRDDDRRQPVQQTRSSDAEYITLDQAIAIATQRAPGRVEEAERDRDDGRVYYEIEIETNRGEVEIEVDAKTGEIISIEYDD